MKIGAAEFKVHCLALLDRVRERGEPIVITKRGKVVAKLVAAGEVDERPWLRARGRARWRGDPFAPVVAESEIEAAR